jgi:CheY-like chemotaxis protein
MASILVIDDDHAVLATIKILLERAHHELVVTDDGNKGLQLLQTQPFDLVLVDIFMPAMDGLETMQLVHQQKPGIPIIVMSGQQFRSASYPAPDFLHMATRLGAVTSLRKPFKPVELLAAVDQCLAALPRAASG